VTQRTPFGCVGSSLKTVSIFIAIVYLNDPAGGTKMSDIDNKTYTPTSSTIASFAYDLVKSELVVQFKGGEIYTYMSVPDTVYDAMNEEALQESLGNPSSVGKFFHKNIRAAGYKFKKSE
jgi:hypothetical protein